MAAEIDDLQTATFDSFAQADELMKLCRRAPDLFQQQNLDEQARMIRLIESNAIFDGTALSAKYNEPFDLLAEGLEDQTGGPDDPFKRTFVGRVVRWAGRRTRKAAPATMFALAA